MIRVLNQVETTISTKVSTWLIAGILLFICANLCAETKAKDAAILFYKANSYYETGEFAKALGGYSEILVQGLESGNLYYNAANAYFKLGELGKAILYYEKARKFIPQDADLRSNLEYSLSLVAEEAVSSPKTWWIKSLEGLANQFDTDRLAISASVSYFLICILAVLNILCGTRIKKILNVSIVLTGLVFGFAAASFAAKIYEIEFLKPAIVIQKGLDARFEPFDHSTVYFKLNAGNKVFVLSSKKGWSKIRRPDGKTAWAKSSSIEVI